MPELAIQCVQCGENFIFAEKDQDLFYRKNMPLPQRCARCSSKKAALAENAPARFEIICDHCGKHDRVPFQPKVGRSVLCKECYQASKSKTRGA